MKIRRLVGGLALFSAVSLAAGPVVGQTVPRTGDGRPDLQGVWDFRTQTPLQRPTNLGDKAVLTEEEAAEAEARLTAHRARQLEPSEVRTEPLPAGGGGLAGRRLQRLLARLWHQRDR